MMKRRLLDVFEWLGRHGFMVLLAVLVVVAGTWASITLPMSWRVGRPGWFGPPSAGSSPEDCNAVARLRKRL